jgi:serine/threonine-protein kinase
MLQLPYAPGADVMTLASAPDLIDFLQESQLLEPAQVEEITRRLLPHCAGPEELCAQLVQCHWLTLYQAEQLVAGNHEDLILGPYRLMEPLGEGGMGQVFKARQQWLNRVVALKIMRQDVLTDDEEVLRRFQREARAAAQLSHPNVVLVYGADQVDDRHFISMEYVQGTDLFKLVRRRGPLPLARACDFIRQAALGLQHAHENGLVHRDIKPSNLFLTVSKPGGPTEIYHYPPLPDPFVPVDKPVFQKPAEPAGIDADCPPGAVVKILDMGIARLIGLDDARHGSRSLTHEGVLMGTPDYMAPEQARSARAADIRSDLYSLGCTFYFLLTGQPPFPRGSMIEKLMKHQRQEPRPIQELCPNVSPRVAAVLHRLLAKDPDDRYQTPADLVAALGAAPTSCPSLLLGRLPAGDPIGASAAGSEAGTAGSGAPPLEPAPPSDAGARSATAACDSSMGSAPQRLSGHLPATRVALLKGHHGWVTALAFSPDRQALASGGVDGVVRLWSFSQSRLGDQVLPRSHRGEVSVLAFAPDGRTLASGGGGMDGLIVLWDLSAGHAEAKAVIAEHPGAVEALAFAPDGQLLVSGGTNGTVHVWDLTGPQPREAAMVKGHTDAVKAAAFSPDGQLIATGGQDGSVSLWARGKTSSWSRVRHGLKEKARLCLGLGAEVIRTLAFAATEALLAVGSTDQGVHLWDLRNGEPRQHSVLTGIAGAPRFVLFPLDGRTLLSAGDGGRVVLWDVATGTPLHTWQLPQTMLCCLVPTHDGRYVAAGHSDGSVSLSRLYPKSLVR